MRARRRWRRRSTRTADSITTSIACASLMRLDSPYCDARGLNLSWEMLEGLAKHNGPVAEPGWALAELDAAVSAGARHAGLARGAGRRARRRHRLRQSRHRRRAARRASSSSTICSTLDFVRDQWNAVRSALPDAAATGQLRELVRDQIGLMVNDVIAATRDRISRAWPRSRRCAAAGDGAGRASRSEWPASERALKRFMYDGSITTREQRRHRRGGARGDRPALCRLRPGPGACCPTAGADHAGRRAGGAGGTSPISSPA